MEDDTHLWAGGCIAKAACTTRLHQRPRAAPASYGLLGAVRELTSSICATCWRRRAGCPAWNAARAATAYPTRSSSSSARSRWASRRSLLQQRLSHGRSRPEAEEMGVARRPRQTLWGRPAPRSWFEEGTLFPGVCGARAGAGIAADRGAVRVFPAAATGNSGLKTLSFPTAAARRRRPQRSRTAASVAAMTSAMRMPAMKPPAPLSSEPKSATPMALPVWRIASRMP